MKNWFKVPEEKHSPIDVSGHRFEPEAIVQGAPLVLNGAGLRCKDGQPVYAAGLYLPEIAHREDTAKALLGARRVQLCILTDLKPSDYIDSMRDAITKNTNVTSREFIREEQKQLEEVMIRNSPMYKGDVVNFDWLPGIGATVTKNGKRISDLIRGKALYDAVLSIWLGSESLEEDLKRALLSGI